MRAPVGSSGCESAFRATELRAARGAARRSGNKATASPPRLTDFDSASRHELVRDGALACARPQQPAYPLHVLTLPEGSPDDDGDVCVGNVEALVEYPCRHKRAEIPAAEALEDIVAFLTADVARERHDQMFPGDRVGRVVVRGEDQNLGVAVAFEQGSQRATLGMRERKEPSVCRHAARARRPEGVRAACRLKSAQLASGAARRKSA